MEGGKGKWMTSNVPRLLLLRSQLVIFNFCKSEDSVVVGSRQCI